jgi:CDP-diacylglycerol--serine O-phosphatidyltransferase
MIEPPAGTEQIERPRRPRRFRLRDLSEAQREHRRRRIRRRGRRAYIRSVYSLPSLATLGNAICGFGAVWISILEPSYTLSNDPWTRFLLQNHFLAAAYLIFMSMLFDAIDGRLARFARHTTDFGGQLDSLADVISFGFAPMLLAMKVFHDFMQESSPNLPPVITRMIWAIGALYMCCAMIRLARFNVSNEHGEQHHFSFLGLPSPGAAAVVASFVLVQQDLIEGPDRLQLVHHSPMYHVSFVMVCLLPPLVMSVGLLMVSTIRYPHLVNRYLRGRRSIGRLLVTLIVLLLFVIVHRYTLAAGTLAYAFWGPTAWAIARIRRRTGILSAARATPGA